MKGLFTKEIQTQGAKTISWHFFVSLCLCDEFGHSRQENFRR
jgi:hypothetical protein